jgi:pyruvate/2-oxoglutarate dehydrogenase complex dihydrolipoamide acyltransferase (E2) component
VSALLEFDVTETRQALKESRRQGSRISFNGWLIKIISDVLVDHREATAFLHRKNQLMIFNDINVSTMVEKSINSTRVPIPLVIEKANEKSAEAITAEIEEAKHTELSAEDVVINKKPSFSERLYYRLPGFLRRLAWKVILDKPKFTFKKMGNVMVTSVGMIGKINGWFLHRSIHPVSFGVGSIIQKPVVVDGEIKIRDILNMTILVDHDLLDGGEMVRLLNQLTRRIENNSGVE